ncbi:MAG: type II secretion system protein [Planctomycetes bacterium]|nr:type II secretion system protein [Planctomycetota bacterium]
MTQPSTSRPRRRCIASSAFTLAEMIVSLTILSVLSVGVASAVLVATQTIEREGALSTRILAAADVSNQMMVELGSAVNVVETGATAVTMAVPDRDGNGETEQIRYSWSGVAGDPLNREYNSEPAFAILKDLRSFSLAYDTAPLADPAAAGNEYSVASHKSTADLSSFKPNASKWISQCFRPALPAGGTGWKLKRISIYAKNIGGVDGQLTIELRTAQADGRPGTQLVCQTVAYESDLSGSFTWASFGFPSGSCLSGWLSPSQSFCLIVKGSVNDSCELRYHHKNAAITNYYLATSDNGGASWSILNKQTMLFEVFATVNGVSGGGTSSRSALAAVRWQLSVGADAAAQIDGGAQLVNGPELMQ